MYMSVNIIRYPSNESGLFSRKGRNQITLQVPGNAGISDFEHSDVLFKMRMDTDVMPGDPGFRPMALQVPPGMLVASCEEHSSKLGIISSNSHVNIVNGNMTKLTMSRQKAEAARNLGKEDGYYSIHGNKATGTWTNAIGDSEPEYRDHGLVTPFWMPGTPDKLGSSTTVNSQMLTPEIAIPLSFFSALANSPNARNQIPNIVLGDLKYTLNLDTNIRGTEYLRFAEWLCEDATSDGSGDLAEVQLSYVFEDNQDLKKLNLGVGMLVTVEWTGAAAGSQNAVISKVSVSSAGVCTLTVDLSGLGAGTDLTGVTVNLPDPPADTPEYAIETADLKVHGLKLSPNQFDNAIKAMENLVIRFPDHYVVTSVVPTGPIFNDTIRVPKSARGVVALTPQHITSPDDARNMYSGYDNVVGYRYSVTDYKGVLRETTNTDVPVTDTTGRFSGSSDFLDVWCERGLHNIRLNDLFTNIGGKLKRYERYGPITDADQLARNGIVGFYPQMLVPAAELNDMKLKLVTNYSSDMSQKTIYYVFIRDRALIVNRGQLSLE